MSRRSSLATVLAGAVDRQVRQLLAEVRTTSPLYDLMEYHLGLDAGAAAVHHAKRIRPVIMLSLAQSLGGDVTASLPVAAGIELLHNAALVFDDIQDRSALRRGRPAVWRVAGAAQALNVGVALQAMVHVATASAASAGLPPERALLAAEELALCTLRLAEGQYLDLGFDEAARPSIDDYMRACAGKTASLLASATHLSAALAGRTDLGEAARRFGYHMGMQLQIQDDIAGIWGDAGVMGKAAADLEGRKKTLPLLYAFQALDAPPELAALEERYYGGGSFSAQDVEQLRRYAEELGGRAYAAEMAAFHRELALHALGELGGGGPELTAVLDEMTAAFAVAR